MKASELRIGNIVSLYGSQATIIPNDFEKWFQHEPEWQNKAFKPIPLTEEWLLKFGFELSNNGWFDIKYDSNNEMTTEAHTISINIESARCSISFVGYYNESDVVPFPKPSNVYTGVDIQFVHQLQNLYFALTGEELEIK